MSSRGVNKAIIIGNLGQEPEVRYLTSGDCVANISVATSEVWKDKNTGEQQEATEWHRVVFYRRLAEVVRDYLHKGSKVYVEGRLRTRKWTDQNGVERYSTSIVGNEMQMLDSAAREEKPLMTRSGVPAQTTPNPTPASHGPTLDDFDDDIPFFRIGDEHLF